jgi:hypothetical protein
MRAGGSGSPVGLAFILSEPVHSQRNGSRKKKEATEQEKTENFPRIRS